MLNLVFLKRKKKHNIIRYFLAFKKFFLPNIIQAIKLNSGATIRYSKYTYQKHTLQSNLRF